MKNRKFNDGAFVTDVTRKRVNNKLFGNRKKNKPFFPLVQAVILGLVIFSFCSCKKDKSCPAGWKGDNCKVSIKSEMLGWYNAVDQNDNDQYDSYQYPPRIKDGAVDPEIEISFFGSSIGGPDDFAVANVSFQENVISFVIPSQIFADDLRLEGSGTYNRTTKELTIHYSYSDRNATTAAWKFTGIWKKE
jgi:hypothetical protein